MRHSGSLRMYESVLRRLAARGHEVLIVANRRDLSGTATSAQTGRLKAAPTDTQTGLLKAAPVYKSVLQDVPGVRWQWEDVEPGAWFELAATVRIWLDYLRYCEPRYKDAPRLRMRVGERVPAPLRRITGWPGVRTAVGRRALTAVLRIVERVIPRQQGLDALMRDYRPDVVLLTPLVHLGSQQVEVLRSARAAGVRTVLCVASWDHLSSKGRIGELPDRVFVWNDTQLREATTLHGVPADRVTLTGAQCYDHWFGRTPARSREEFCSMVGLLSERPFLLYACSALYPQTPPEAPFVRRWIEEIRSSDDPILRGVPILVRPHPARLEEWRDVDLSAFRDVALHGSLPLDEASKEDYFEALSYCAAMIGLNTSVFLEAAIVGCPVHTIVVPEFAERQEGTLHFHYLRSVGGGLLRLARSFDEHRAALAASAREGWSTDRNRPFVEAFIRPLGLGRAATDVFVEAVEALGRETAPSPARQPIWVPVVRLALTPVARAVSTAVASSSEPADRTVVELQQARRRERHRRQREADEGRRKAAREAARLEKLRGAEVARERERHAREERLATAERQKRESKALRERQKAQRERAKRRAAFVHQVKRRFGLGA